MQWDAAWTEYIAGVIGTDGQRVPRVPSEHARQLTQTFLLNTQARSQDSDSDEDVADNSGTDEDLPTINFNSDDIERILRKDIHQQSNSDEEPCLEQHGSHRAQEQAFRRNQNYVTMRRGAEIWKTAASKIVTEGTIHADTMQDNKVET